MKKLAIGNFLLIMGVAFEIIKVSKDTIELSDGRKIKTVAINEADLRTKAEIEAEITVIENEIEAKLKAAESQLDESKPTELQSKDDYKTKYENLVAMYDSLMSKHTAVEKELIDLKSVNEKMKDKQSKKQVSLQANDIDEFI